MSVHKEAVKSLNINSFKKMKENNEKISCLTAYDYTSAKILDRAGVDLLLIGDSLGMVMNGYNSTIPVTLDEIIYHTKAVKRGTERAFIVADMPYGSCNINLDETMRNIIRIAKETEVPAVKIEGGKEAAPLIKKITENGMAVMGHIGLKPQSINTSGGYKIYGKNGADELIEDAAALEEAGVFSIIIEGVTAESASKITKSVNVPTIGIGAGAGCDGQILVYHDIFGLFNDFKPKFVKRYANLAEEIEKAAKEYINDVKNGIFPGNEHSY